MPPDWLTALSWAALALALACAGWIAFDVYGRGYRQRMGVMEAVWPVTALYFGPAAAAAYRAWGRPASRRWQREHGDPPPKPGYADSPVYWLGMQIGMIAGFFTAWPVNVWLIRTGVKEAM